MSGLRLRCRHLDFWPYKLAYSCSSRDRCFQVWSILSARMTQELREQQNKPWQACPMGDQSPLHKACSLCKATLSCSRHILPLSTGLALVNPEDSIITLYQGQRHHLLTKIRRSALHSALYCFMRCHFGKYERSTSLHGPWARLRVSVLQIARHRRRPSPRVVDSR